MSPPDPPTGVAKVNFEQLVDAQYAGLYRFAYSLAKNEMQAADLTQQTFYIWATKGQKLRDTSKAKTWLFTTLYREFLGGRRHETRFPKVGLDDAPEQAAPAPSRKCLRRAKQFARAMDVPARPPRGTKLYLMAGDAIPTPAVATVSPNGQLLVTQTGPGDGTVLRSSALMDERVSGKWSPELRSPIAWGQVSFYFKEHLALTQDIAFTDNLLFILLEEPRR